MSAPIARLTIVTSVLNGEPYIAQMLESIPAGLPIEHLVIDAGSTDGTLARLLHTPNVQLISRPGMALYAAWNLALERAAGEAIWFVNADDVLPVGAVETILSALERHPVAEIVQGRAEAFSHNDDDHVLRQAVSYPAPGKTLNLVDLIFGAPAINARVYRRQLIERAVPFDTAYRFAADRDWLLRVALAARPPVCIDVDALLYRYRVHEGSMTLSQGTARRLAIAREHARIVDRLLPAILADATEGRLLNAWRARELLIGATVALGDGDIGEGAQAAARLIANLPRSLVDLARARRYRRAYIDRLGGRSQPS